MQISFRFENGTSQIVLSPENQRDKNYLALCVDGKDNLRIKPTTTDELVIEFKEIKDDTLRVHSKE